MSRSDGFLVNFMDWVYIRYAIFILPLIGILVWYVPYQDVTYRVVAEEQAWTYLFPNLRKVLKVPFANPQKMSGALVVLDVLFVGWFVFTIILGPKYIRAVKGWQERLAHYKKKESFKMMVYSVVMMAAGGAGVFAQDGRHDWMWGGFLYKNELVFILFNILVAWFVVWSYLLMVVYYLKFTKEQ